LRINNAISICVKHGKNFVKILFIEYFSSILRGEEELIKVNEAIMVYVNGLEVTLQVIRHHVFVLLDSFCKLGHRQLPLFVHVQFVEHAGQLANFLLTCKQIRNHGEDTGLENILFTEL
jgi:hypothetical protein